MFQVDDELSKIKDLELALIAGYEMAQSDIDFLFSCLLATVSEEARHAALLLLTESDDTVLDLLMDRYGEFSVEVRHLMLSYFTTTDYVQCYVFLLDILKQAPSEEEVNIVVFCLANTDYFIFPLILTELNSDNAIYVAQLKRLLVMIGIDRLKSYLAVMPVIPHEALFRDIFGADVIDQIKHS